MPDIGGALPIWSVLPFVGLLMSMAIIPSLKPGWWERNMLRHSVFWALMFLVPFGLAFGAHQLAFNVVEVVALDYIPFLVLLFGLFVVTGGIAIEGTLVGTTRFNTALLLLATVLAGWIGTTGAAALMIRPLIRANAWRSKQAHLVVFFIFLVANMGGCLTPLGDPPLFMGFLRGVPYLWTMRLWPILLLNVALVTAVFALVDRHCCRLEFSQGRSPSDMTGCARKTPVRIVGAHNLVFLLMIIGAVILSGAMPDMNIFADPATGQLYGFYLFEDIFISISYVTQIALILLAAALSMRFTRPSIRELNGFALKPIAEVAKVFIGIFLTMIPALALLRAHGAALGLDTPAELFWASGTLSSFLDNTPTYVVFLTTIGASGFSTGVATTVGTVPAALLEAISVGAVFMGASTYIGNAPNLMVKSIAEENDVKMPSFLGYMKWSFCVLAPVFVIDTLVFFNPLQ